MLYTPLLLKQLLGSIGSLYAFRLPEFVCIAYIWLIWMVFCRFCIWFTFSVGKKNPLPDIVK